MTPDDFRNKIKLKLTKNSNKIIENLRKLSEGKANISSKKSVSNMTSRIEDYEHPYADMNLHTYNNHSDLFHHSSISSHNLVNVERKSKSPGIFI
jgi:hypothetical protein